jgi:hypothetical protein
LQLRLASSFARARPIPLEAPVMIATLLERSIFASPL